MKRSAVVVLGSIVFAVAIFHPVYAYGWGWGIGHYLWGGWHGGTRACWQDTQESDDLNQEQRTQLNDLRQNFYNETAMLRNEIGTKSRELDILMNSSNPDPGKVKALQKELNALHANISNKRLDFALEARKIDPDARLFDARFGKGHDRIMETHGPGACWH
jgi:zinc resistance-associated protein